MKPAGNRPECQESAESSRKCNIDQKVLNPIKPAGNPIKPGRNYRQNEQKGAEMVDILSMKVPLNRQEPNILDFLDDSCQNDGKIHS